MKSLIIISLMSLFLTSCAHKNGGYYSRENQDTYRLMIGGAVENPEYSFQRGAYEICKNGHDFGGFSILEKKWNVYEGGGSAINGRILCTGKDDSFLSAKFEKDKTKYQETDFDLLGYEKEFQLLDPSNL